MNKFITPLAAAAALAACSAAPVALAENAPPRIISVSGVGEASGTPDLAILSIGVETEAKTAAAALQQNSVKMNAVTEKLKARGVAEKDMQTQNLSVGPRYDYQQNSGTPRLIGYVANNTLTVKLRDLAKAGSIIDDAVGDGANSLSSLTFGFADTNTLMNEARKAAVEDAKAKATLYVKAAGVSLGPVMQIQEGYSAFPPPQPYMEMRAMSADAKSTPISAGESTLTSNITIIYEIR